MQESVQLSDQQRRIVAHPPTSNARVLAGPGSGKSFTAMFWLGELMDQELPPRVKMLTFTRAATAEFADKLAAADLADVVGKPATVHSHALSVLMGMEGHGLPEPLRIPDTWETSTLIHPHLSRLLKKLGHSDATPRLVKRIEGEMATGWQTLNEGIVLLSDVEPELRTAYVNAWGAHRLAFGYSLLNELTYRAGIALEDLGEDHPPKVDLLLVDEYQDLNAADIRFIAAHRDLGIALVAIGDDDQSIYGWRHADPAGIRRFCNEFAPAEDYTLTISRRCGSSILAAANELIATAPGRAPKPPLQPADGSSPGVFAYTRFSTRQVEAAGAAAIAAARVRAGVDPSGILLLVRSLDDRWRRVLEPHFLAVGLTISSTDGVKDGLGDLRLRAGIALGRLFTDPEDSLAWWALTEGLTPLVGPSFTDFVYEARGERWAQCLLRLQREGFPGLGGAMIARVDATMRAVEEHLVEMRDIELDPNDELGWAGWLIEDLTKSDWFEGLAGDELSDDARRLLELVGPHVELDAGLSGLLNQLEPVGGDLAAQQSGGVRLMNMGASKGLTVNTTIVLGVEESMVPMPPPKGDLDEE